MRSLSFGFICMMNKFIFSFNKSSWEWKFMDEWDFYKIYNNWVIVNFNDFKVVIGIISYIIFVL